MYKFSKLTEESASEEKIVTPKQKAIRKVGRAKPKVETTLLEVSSDVSGSDSKSIIELNEEEVKPYRRTRTSIKISTTTEQVKPNEEKMEPEQKEKTTETGARTVIWIK